MLLSIIFPIKVDLIDKIEGLVESILSLYVDGGYDLLEILIVNDSPNHIFLSLDLLLNNARLGGVVRHLKPNKIYFTGLNNKLNSIHSALYYAQGKYVLLLDDDSRPCLQSILVLIDRLQTDLWDCFRCSVHYRKYLFIDLLNMSSILFINAISPDKQFWGNIGFNRKKLLQLGFPNKNVLFDELAIYRKFNQRKRVAYFDDISIEMVSTTSIGKFLKQRVRYAYENMAYPLRFFISLMILPVMLYLLWVSNGSFKFFFTFLSIFILGVIIVGLIGQCRYGTKLPLWTFLFTPLWYSSYIICSWLAIIAYFFGGIQFGGSKIRHVI